MLMVVAYRLGGERWEERYGKGDARRDAAEMGGTQAHLVHVDELHMGV